MAAGDKANPHSCMLGPRNPAFSNHLGPTSCCSIALLHMPLAESTFMPRATDLEIITALTLFFGAPTT